MSSIRPNCKSFIFLFGSMLCCLSKVESYSKKNDWSESKKETKLIALRDKKRKKRRTN